MCGIFGVLGRPGAPRLVKQGLQALEYRGYDSCGATWPGDKALDVSKAVGPVSNLQIDAEATVAIGHTRWATHGGVTQANAHPHLSEDRRAAVVHNGVLLNHQELRRGLESQGVAFASETDSESLVHLWRLDNARGLERLRGLLAHLDGTYSLAILDMDEDAVFVGKNRNPMWVAHVDGCTLFASDAVALRKYVTQAVPLEDGDHGRLTADGFDLFDARGRVVVRTAVDITAIDDRADKAGYEHYMLKEIHETPAAMNRILAEHLSQAPPYVDLGSGAVRAAARILTLGAGTSYHAGLLGAEYMRRIARVPASARQSPEYKDELDVPEAGTLVTVLSQSGETLDTLQAVHRLRSHPFSVLALTNHPTSTIGRLADEAVALGSGMEVSVAATKTFLSQSLLLYMLALSRARPTRSDAFMAHAAKELIMLPRALQRTLNDEARAQSTARALAGHDNLFLLAKGLHVPAALEGALKLKEIAYQHAEAYPAGELKHGPFALLTPETPVVFLLGDDGNQSKICNSIEEVAARGAPVHVLAIGDVDVPAAAHSVWRLPRTSEDLSPFVFSTALHLLSYWVAKARGLPIDKPRNLAKSVTVE